VRTRLLLLLVVSSLSGAGQSRDWARYRSLGSSHLRNQGLYHDPSRRKNGGYFLSAAMLVHPSSPGFIQHMVKSCSIELFSAQENL
jgi:hypothetical protein